MAMNNPDTWYEKTSQESLAPTKEKISDESLKKQPELPKQMPLYLDLRKENDLNQAPSWEMGGQLLEEYTMHSFGEFPSEDAESHLLQILEEKVPQEYYLSEKARKGILSRAKIRKKGLPEILRQALEEGKYTPRTTLTEKRFFEWYVDDIGVTLRRRSGSYGGGSEVFIIESDGVRKLTPVECERLQGFPDNWTDIGEWVDAAGKTHNTTKTARYEALGNSIALPFWKWLLKRVVSQYSTPPTMGSLFDGIGGFPLCWQEAGGITKWTSEIEEFPIAVVQERFKDKE